MISICIKIMHTQFKNLFEFQLPFISYVLFFVLYADTKSFCVRAFFSPLNAVNSFYFEKMKYFCVIAEKTNYFKCKFIFFRSFRQCISQNIELCFDWFALRFFFSATNLEFWSSENWTEKKSESCCYFLYVICIQ